MALDLIRQFYEVHQWANRQLFDVAAALGEEVAGRHIGVQFSAPSLRGILAHIYSNDWEWLQTWRQQPLTTAPGENAESLGELRGWWDEVESDQRGFLAALDEARIGRVVEPNTGKTFGMLLLHVPNHATHHRSEILTMLTMLSGSPQDPLPGVNSFYRWKAAQRPP